MAISGNRPCYAMKDGKVVGHYLSMAEASKKTGVSRGSVKNSLEEGFITVDGYSFYDEKPRIVKNVETKEQLATRLAMNVEWLTHEERELYAGAIYAALCWGEKQKANKGNNG